jgi:hypothetical protein
MVYIWNDPTLLPRSSNNRQSLERMNDFIATLRENQLLAPATVALVGAAAWYFKLIIQFLVGSYQRRTREIELVQAIRAEISTLYQSHEKEFREETLRATHDLLDRLENAGQSRPLVTNDTTEQFVFSSLKNDFTSLPSSTIDAVVEFYTVNNLFDSSYRNQSHETFKTLELETKKKIVDEVHELAQLCVNSGKNACEKLDASVRLNSILLWNMRIYGILLPILACGAVAIWAQN